MKLCDNCKDSGKWGHYEWHENEPYGDYFVPVFKGYQPCQYCWRGAWIRHTNRIRRAFYSLVDTIKSGVLFPVEEDDIPF